MSSCQCQPFIKQSHGASMLILGASRDETAQEAMLEPGLKIPAA